MGRVCSRPRVSEISGGWKFLHSTERNKLYSFPNKEDEMGGHVACMRVKRIAYRVLIRVPEGKKTQESIDIDGRIILKHILEKQDCCELDSSNPREGLFALLKKVKSSDSITCCKFLE
jgi:hypothetical protein